MTNPKQNFTREDGSVDVFGALENAEALRQQTATLSIRRGAKRLFGALTALALRPGTSKETNRQTAG